MAERPTGTVSLLFTDIEGSTRLLQRLGDRYGEVGDLADQLVDTERARSLIEESLALRRTLGEKRGIAVTVMNLGGLLLTEDQPEGAIPLFEESLTLAREVGLVPHTAWALAGLGLAAILQHAPDRAAPLLQESLELARDLHDQVTVAECLAGLAGVAAERGELLQAARLWGATERIHQRLGFAPTTTRFLDRDRLPACARLGGEAFEAARAAGKRLPIEQAVAEAVAM